jgi:hypothetical protein
MSGLQEVLYKIGSEYTSAKKENFTNHPLGHYVRSEAIETLKSAVNLNASNFIFKGSVGQSAWSDIPWLAILDPLVTRTVQAGYYAVYLFSADGKNVYLCLAQGVEAIKGEFKKDWSNVLGQRANLL